MKLIIYYVVALVANIVSAIAFRSHLNITALSAVPAILTALMIFQAFYFKNNDPEEGFSTAYSLNSEYNDKDFAVMSQYSFKALFIVLPFMLPFVFFGNWIKLVSIFVYIIGFIAGPIFYRMKHKNEVNERVDKEKDELKEQKAKEELGKWK